MAMSRSRGARSFTTRSAMRTSPSLISSKPAIMRSAVVLPQPDGPTRQMNSPSAMSRLSLSTASVPPAYRLVRLSSTTRAIRSASLHCAREHAADEISLESEEHNERHDDRDDGTGGYHPIVGGELPDLVEQEDCERSVRATAEKYERDQKVVPHPDELKDPERRCCGDPEGQHHSPEKRPLPRAVDASCLEQVLGNPRVEVAHEKDPEGKAERDMEQHHARDCPERVETGERAKKLVEPSDRYQGHLQRHHQ